MHIHVIEIILLLLLAVAGLAYLAKRLDVPYPLMLVIGGLLIGFTPGLPHVALDPDFVFLLFLPPLLYYGALLTSWRDFRANLRPISLLAVGLTLFTTIAVAAVARVLIPNMTWPIAFVLGAIISPPDAIAATAVLNKLGVPRRIVTVLEGESLVNDAIALVAYRFAVAAAVTGAFSLPTAAWQFVVVSVGGVAVGLLAGAIVTWLRPRIHDYTLEMTLSLLTPYLAYLPAEHLGVSGVLASVTVGLYVARQIPSAVSPTVRLRAYAVWDVFVFILNGLVFILIGLELPVVVEGLKTGTQLSWPTRIGWALLIGGAAISVRLLWVLTATYVPRWLIPSLRRTDPTPPFGQVFVVAWTGMRGIVSLAAALSLPVVLSNPGTPAPGRNLIIFLTFSVIVVTLLAQGLTLPWVIRALHVQDDGEDDRDEEVMARYLTALAAVERLDELSVSGGETLPAESFRRVRNEYDARLAYYSRQLNTQFGASRSTSIGGADGGGLGADNAYDEVCTSEHQLRRNALTAERSMLLKLRDNGTIADDILRRVQQSLDLEESRLDAE